ncbi:MAG: hypothetical protein KF862_22440 [Chitinophagaceae bacterium]|nr:hypothetical protein [Chitinophagaceae bacterium]
MENFETTSVAPAKPKRPTFLTVLCILTFIGSGFGIINGTSSYLTADAAAGVAQAAMEDAREKIENESSNPGAQIAEKMLAGASDMFTPENIKKNASFSIVASVFTLIGAILMFGLKKTGYWSYILGTLIGIVAPFVVYGGGNLLTILTSSGIAFIGVLFVVLYGLNFKHLR